MIIDCHGHYTTAPKQLESWRQRQIAALADKSQPRAKARSTSATTRSAPASRARS